MIGAQLAIAAICTQLDSQQLSQASAVEQEGERDTLVHNAMQTLLEDATAVQLREALMATAGLLASQWRDLAETGKLTAEQRVARTGIEWAQRHEKMKRHLEGRTEE